MDADLAPFHYSPDADIALWPVEERHALCPFGTRWLQEGRRLVDLPGSPSPGTMHPWSVHLHATPGATVESFAPDLATRERLREAIDAGIRWRMAQAMRADGCALGVRGIINVATRVFEQL